MRKVAITVLAVLYSIFLWAANGVTITQSTIGNGLESQSLNVLAKDRLGRLWIGSDVGISMFSNGIITNIRDIASQGGQVILGKVNCIVCTNTVLMASEDRILHYDHNKRFAQTITYDDIILHTNDFLLEGDIATFYDAGMKSLFSYDMEKDQCDLVYSFSGNEDFNFTRILRSETDSTLLFLADDKLGLYSFNRKTTTLQRVPGTPSPILAKATAIDRSNVIWLSVQGSGISGYYINSNYEPVAQYNTRNCDLLSDHISLITPLPDGNILTVHDEKGICVIERKNVNNGRVLVKQYPNLKNVSSLIVNMDERETLYATQGYGLVTMKTTFIGQIHHLYEHEEGIVNFENYLSALEEPQGTVLLGTKGNGICRISPLTQERTNIPGTGNLKITSMCHFDDNLVLMADNNERLLLLDRTNGKVSSLSRYPQLEQLNNSNLNNIRLKADDNGNIFIFNVDSHHYVYRKNQDRLLEFGLLSYEGQPVKTIDNICITPYAVYVTYRGTIIEINYNTLESRCIYRNKDKIIHNITSMASNSQGELFFTEPEGLHRYDPRSNFDEILVTTWGNGRFMNIAIDRLDRIWFTTTYEYLHLYDFAKKELIMYSIQDGVPASRFLNNFSLATTSGFVLFPDADGLVNINTNASLLYDTPPVKVSCISAGTDKKQFSGSDIEKSLKRPLKLSGKFNELNLEFSANAFNPTYSHLFTYDIYKNNSLVYSRNTTNTFLTIPRMDYGTYSVVVRQAYRKGWSDPETLFMFKIPKPFLRTIPGVLLALILMLIFGYSIAKLSSNMEKNRMEKAMAAQEIKNREDKISFLSNIAHELRTPLSLIYNPVKDFLQEKSVDGIDYERMERIFNQVNKMTVMVNMILDSSRADINKADILIEEVNLNEWLNFLLEDYRIDCYGKGFSLKFIMDNSIGNVSIDKRIIETGLSNMVNNAIKYSTSGTTITVSTEKRGDRIRVSVKDQGRGFSCDPEDLFKRFYRENTDSNIPGYGLGLPYARLQLSLIGGTMSAMNNQDEQGSTFYMEFPSVIDKNGQPAKTRNADKTEQTASTQDKPETREGMAQDFDTNNMTILYVTPDDNLFNPFNNMFKTTFRLIMRANEGSEAAGLLMRMNIDLVISDVEMPDMDGFELCRKIKSTLDISHIPVILLTSRTDARNNNVGYKMSADAFIVQPDDLNQMYAIIRSQLGGRFEIKRQYNYGFFSMMSPDQTFSMTDEVFIRTLNELIEKHVSQQDFNEDSIYDQLKISRTAMLKKMDGLLATNLSAYLRRIRIDIVKELLEGSDQDLETIAGNSGFKSVEEMEKAFKRETGKTVNSVRNQ